MTGEKESCRVFTKLKRMVCDLELLIIIIFMLI